MGFWCSTGVRKTVLKSASLAQASLARLGETCRDSHSYLTRGSRSGDEY